MKIMKFIEILDFCESGGSKTLTFLRNYWCFCNVMNFMKFHFFQWNSWNLWNFIISLFFTEINEKIIFHEKSARRRPGDLKRHGISLVKQGFPASGRQGATKSYLRQKLKKFPSDFGTKQIFMKIMKFSWISWFSTCQNHWYSLGNT